ncbi:MAG TPA: amino acid ABC transporter substrate-binding protein [Candidatus Elarobacter sp.]|jgi:branched-chain amino acid transport system substrate-binding protein|nr:amino acid ABC transporter substrate-binding protein [Candidatus Elarobacter sp.]
MTDQPLTIGYCLSLSGGLASNGRTARLAHQLWQDDVNGKGGLLGRKVELLCLDDETNPERVAPHYQRLLDTEKVDLVIGGYGDNSVAPAMPLIMERKKFFVGLMALAVNARFKYANYFVMIPTGPKPSEALTEGFFDVLARQTPKPETVAILAADAPFSVAPVQGAKENLERNGMHVVWEQRYPLATSDFGPFVDELKSLAPDVLFICSYIKDSAGLLKAVAEKAFEPKALGGAMIGPQNGVVKAELGPLLNGLINYEYWLPVPGIASPESQALIERYQLRANAAEADPLGYYVAPMAYAQMQVVEQAVKAVGSLDDAALAAYAHGATFRTVVGDVTFGSDGSWTQPRVLTVQFRSINSNDIGEFKTAATEAIVHPAGEATAKLIYPYANAKAQLRT